MVKRLLFLWLLGCALSESVSEFKMTDFELLADESTWFLGFVDKSCDSSKKVLAKFASATPTVKVGAVDADKDPEMARLFEAKKLPAFFFIKNNVIREFKEEPTLENIEDFITDKYLFTLPFDVVDNLKTRQEKKVTVVPSEETEDSDTNSDDQRSNVVPISIFNYDVLESGSWLLFASTFWCSSCKKIVPIWEELSNYEEFKKKGINVAAFDGDEYPNISKRLNIFGYPGLLFIKDRVAYRFEKSRDFESFVHFANEGYKSATSLPLPYYGPSFVSPITTTNTTKLASGDWLLLVYTPWCGSNCTKLELIWDTLAVASDVSHIRMAKVDVDVDRGLQFLFGVELKTSIYRFSNGNAYLFNSSEPNYYRIHQFAKTDFLTFPPKNVLSSPCSFFRRSMSTSIQWTNWLLEKLKKRGISETQFIFFIIGGAVVEIILLIFIILFCGKPPKSSMRPANPEFDKKYDSFLDDLENTIENPKDILTEQKTQKRTEPKKKESKKKESKKTK